MFLGWCLAFGWLRIWGWCWNLDGGFGDGGGHVDREELMMVMVFVNGDGHFDGGLFEHSSWWLSF